MKTASELGEQRILSGVIKLGNEGKASRQDHATIL